MASAVTRLSVNLAPPASQALDWLAHRKGMTKTDVVEFALRLYRLAEEARDEGGHLAVMRPDGAAERVHLL